MVKKVFCFVGLVAFCLCVLPGCVMTSESRNTAPVETAASTTIGQGNWEDYSGFLTESQAAFAELILDNPIDRDYRSEPTDQDGTLESAKKKEGKYSQIWLEELSFSVENFAAVLQEGDKEQFLQIQSDWLKNLNEEYSFVADIYIRDSEYAPQGTIFRLERGIYYRERIRERTLYIKYLLYLEKGDESVTFLYTGN